jgi:hypothetical protein
MSLQENILVAERRYQDFLPLAYQRSLDMKQVLPDQIAAEKVNALLEFIRSSSQEMLAARISRSGIEGGISSWVEESGGSRLERSQQPQMTVVQAIRTLKKEKAHKLSPLEAKMRRIFGAYCGLNNSHNVSHMGAQNFLRFLHDCGMTNGVFTPVRADLLFRSLCKISPDGADTQLSFEEWFEALRQISLMSGNQNITAHRSMTSSDAAKTPEPFQPYMTSERKKRLMSRDSDFILPRIDSPSNKAASHSSSQLGSTTTGMSPKGSKHTQSDESLSIFTEFLRKGFLLASRKVQEFENDELAHELANGDVHAAFDRHRVLLQNLFYIYSRRDAAAGLNAVTGDITHMNLSMSLNEYLRFLRNFDIIPMLCAVGDASRAFILANATLVSDEHYDELNYAEFVESLGRIALMSFPPTTEGRGSSSMSGVPELSVESLDSLLTDGNVKRLLGKVQRRLGYGLDAVEGPTREKRGRYFSDYITAVAPSDIFWGLTKVPPSRHQMTYSPQMKNRFMQNKLESTKRMEQEQQQLQALRVQNRLAIKALFHEQRSVNVELEETKGMRHWWKERERRTKSSLSPELSPYQKMKRRERKQESMELAKLVADDLTMFEKRYADTYAERDFEPAKGAGKDRASSMVGMYRKSPTNFPKHSIGQR